MKSKHMSALLREDITTVSVLFQRDVANRQGVETVSRYTFKVLREDADKLKSDDLVVVETSKGMQVAQVCEVHADPQIDPDFDGDYKWVVQVVNMERYMCIVQHERELDTVMLNVEREVKRKSVVEMYRETLGKTAVGTRFAALLKGPALAAPAAAPAAKKTAKK